MCVSTFCYEYLIVLLSAIITFLIKVAFLFSAKLTLVFQADLKVNVHAIGCVYVILIYYILRGGYHELLELDKSCILPVVSY